MSLVAVAVIVALLLLAALAVLQILVAVGRPYGALVWGGQHRVLPRNLRLGSVVSVLLYAAFAALLLSRAGVIADADAPFVVIATWVLFGYFTLGILLNGISRSRPERFVMTPTCLLLAASTLVIALS